jgi:hypothetical protein
VIVSIACAVSFFPMVDFLGVVEEKMNALKNKSL